MADIDVDLEKIHDERLKRFRILVCVDGSEESYRGLNYASECGARRDADIILLYVRPIDQGLRTGGLQVRVARENMLKWGLELPGIQYLKKGLEFLKDSGNLGDDWNEKTTHTEIKGDPLGDNKTEYKNKDGKVIVLKLKTASTVAAGILDQYELGPYNMIIMGTSGRWGGWTKAFWDPAVAEKVASHAPCSVLITRDLERGKGYLMCTDGSEHSREMIVKAGEFSLRTDSQVSVMSVALDVESEDEARNNVDEAVVALAKIGIEPKETFVRVGNPIEEIVDAGSEYSIIAVGDTGKTGLKRFFMGSVSFRVLEQANNSVMVVR